MRRAEPQDPGQLGLWLVVPCYRVTSHILEVLAEVPAWVEGVVCVDDACPQGSGQLILERADDPRLHVLTLPENRGVGGAVLAGYREALQRGARIIVKVDGDGQMDLGQIARLVAPILLGQADYTKGNRFTQTRHLASMPLPRLIGNTMLSFAAKLATGYWNTFDPTNGFTAIEATVARQVLEQPVAQGFFFETDMLCHLGALRAVVRDVPIPARYGEEQSNLRIGAVLRPFTAGLLRNTCRRLLRQYLVRDFPIATLEFLAGAALLGAGVVYGLAQQGADPLGGAASPGIVMAAALPILIGVQLLLQALHHDTRSMPTEPIHPTLRAMEAIEERLRRSDVRSVTGETADAQATGGAPNGEDLPHGFRAGAGVDQPYLSTAAARSALHAERSVSQSSS
ncbi:glycosyltransferase family 2 protein [Neoroseomonas soli]|uniref:Glycosyltransferase family 2 protein n=1 Tax=Neoroseomonas soli TaxID=1081025 RepID=A0A9X9X350_9PROT|nr:glycosyltransferase family 2 protein [Neoroseomonas soli]MBR0673829.1 glycosyltransferase family 2 protein [Neoroseomonas soli]